MNKMSSVGELIFPLFLLYLYDEIILLHKA